MTEPPALEVVSLPRVVPPAAWWSPVTALWVGLLGTAVQLVAYYAREVVPIRGTSADLLRYDVIAEGLPMRDSMMWAGAGVFFGIVALGLVWVGWQRNVRSAALQVLAAAAGVAAISLILLPPPS